MKIKTISINQSEYWATFPPTNARILIENLGSYFPERKMAKNARVGHEIFNFSLNWFWLKKDVKKGQRKGPPQAVS